MKPELINIDISGINQSIELINNQQSKEMIRLLESRSISLPDFDSFPLDMVQVPISEEPSILVNNSVYPSDSEYKLKIITFRKNFKTKSWEFASKNF